MTCSMSEFSSYEQRCRTTRSSVHAFETHLNIKSCTYQRLQNKNTNCKYHQATLRLACETNMMWQGCVGFARCPVGSAHDAHVPAKTPTCLSCLSKFQLS